MTACDACLRRTALVARLAPHVERARRDHRHICELLALPDARLIAALAGDLRAEIERAHDDFDPSAQRGRLQLAGLAVVCRHDATYPPRLEDGVAPGALSYERNVALIEASKKAIG